MSTKIFNAYRAPTGTVTARLVAEHVELARRDVTVDAVGIIAVALENARSIRDLLDLIAPFGGMKQSDIDGGRPEPKSQTVYQKACSVLHTAEQYLAKPGGYVLAHGVDTSCAVTFLDDPAGRPWTYLKVFAGDRRLVDAVAGIPGVEDFEYWNHTDRPDGVSARTWKNRAETWGRVLPYGVAPGRVGATWEADLNRPADLMYPKLMKDPWLTPEAVAALAKDPERFLARLNQPFAWAL